MKTIRSLTQTPRTLKWEGYNNFWIDPGDSYGKVNGEYSSSWTLFPENGKVPYSKESGGARMRAFRRGGSEESGTGGAYDGPARQFAP